MTPGKTYCPNIDSQFCFYLSGVMRLYFIVFALLQVSSNAFSQGVEDSLIQLLNTQMQNGNAKAAAKTEYRLAKLYYNSYQDSLCKAHLQNCILLADEYDEIRTKALATNLMGNLTSDLGDHEQAIKLYQQALEFAGANDTLRASFMNNYGLELKTVGRYKDAVHALYTALKLKESIESSARSISSTLLNIGLVWDLIGEPEKALDYYGRSLELKKSLHDSLGISRLLSNMAVIRKNKGELDQAISLIRESIKYNLTIDDIEQHYINHLNLGNIYKKQGHEDLFLLHMDTSYSYAQQINSPDYISDVHQNLGVYYLEQDNFQKAIEHLNKAIEIPGKNITNILLYENHKALAQAYQALNDFPQAYIHLEKSNVFRDSVYVIEHQKAIQDVQGKYEAEKRKRKLAQKDLELTQVKSETRRKTIIILILIGGVFLIGTAGLFLFGRYRQKQRRKLMISEQHLQEYRKEMEMLRLHVETQISASPKKINLKITQEEINQYLIDPLSEREIEVLTEIASGKTNKEVAETIFISENTVKFHLKNIYVKLDVKNRTEAITKASVLDIWNRS